MTGEYGRGEVDARIALVNRTSAELDASVRTWGDDDFEPAVCTVCGLDVHTPEELAACNDSALFQPDDDEPDDDETWVYYSVPPPDDDDLPLPDPDDVDANDSWERLMWIIHPPLPEPYMDGCRLRYD